MSAAPSCLRRKSKAALLDTAMLAVTVIELTGLQNEGEYKSVIVNVGPGWHKIYNSCDFGEVFPSSVSSLNKRQR